jgi:rSAM/selenodomain-associated transferase 2
MNFSVIIPTLNEENCLAATLRSLGDHHPHQVLVVDGGSTDATCSIAESGGARLLHGPRGRAAQMNHGAASASGDALLFLHADCHLEAGALESAARCLRRRVVSAGCFRMRVEAKGRVYRLIDAAATARVRLTGLVYGDQGLFLTRQRFEDVGGFPDLRLMEDVFISKKLRKLGRVEVVSRQVHVSPRRWRHQGVVRQTLRNWTLTALAAGGIHPDRLAAFYPVVR